MSEEHQLPRFGNHKVIEAQHGDNDYVLTDRDESALLGFTVEELPDLQIVLERLDAQIDEELDENPINPEP